MVTEGRAEVRQSAKRAKHLLFKKATRAELGAFN